MPLLTAQERSQETRMNYCRIDVTPREPPPCFDHGGHPRRVRITNLGLVDLQVVVDGALKHGAVIRASDTIEQAVCLGAARPDNRLGQRQERCPFVAGGAERFDHIQRRSIRSTCEVQVSRNGSCTSRLPESWIVG